MSEVEELANKYFEEQCEHTYADTIEELKEDVVTAFLQGYAKGETDEKFRTKQVVTKDMAELEAQIEQLTYLHNEDVNTIKLLNKQIKEIKENDY